MSTKSHDQNRTRLIRLLEPVIYGDIFDYPLTLDEMHKYCGILITLEALQSEIGSNQDFNRLVSSSEGYYFLNGREDLVALRKQRSENSEKARRTACKVVRFIKYTPFIEGILATGSLAVDNVRKKDDLDFLVLASPHRLWFVFFLLGLLQKIFSRRFLCPNYYISVNHLCLSRKSFYTAREAVQARPMFGEETCRRFMEKNNWAYEILPNARNDVRPSTIQDRPAERKGIPFFFCRCIELLFSGKRGDFVEAILKKMLKNRLAVHYSKHGQKVPEEVLQDALDEIELRFHGLKHEEMINQEIRNRKNRVHAVLDKEYGASGGARDSA